MTTNPYQNAMTRGPAIFYGYSSDSGGMRMMDYPDYLESIRKSYSDMYQNALKTMQPVMETVQRWMPSGKRDEHGRCCDPKPDCHCTCCIRDADVIEYTRCGETRIIPLIFDNDTRRERDVKLQLGAFATASGRELGWEAVLSTNEFRLLPCGEQTVLLRVNVDCAKLTGDVGQNPHDRAAKRFPSVDECKVAYATIRAEGCFIRPLVVAIAVLPNDCGAHRSTCQCECCC